jgi:CRISPR-associated protein Cmr6
MTDKTTEARRNALIGLDFPSEHAGLVLHKYLKAHQPESQGEREVIEHLATIQTSEIYQGAFERWHAAMAAQEAVVATVTTVTPLAIGLGNGSPLEIGLSLHHTFGVPYLPGSALKGLALRAALAHGVNDEALRILFGSPPQHNSRNEFDAGSAGQIIFWDGWLEPSKKPVLQRDVMTVHHQAYYGSSGKSGYPTDFDDPNPVGFISVRPGTRFCIAIGSNPQEGMEAWRYVALELLQYGLEQLGLGGKTNAGYGYFTVKMPEKQLSDGEMAQQLLEKYCVTIEQIKAAQDLTKADRIIEEVRSLVPLIRKPTLVALKQQLERIKRWDDEKKRCQDIKALLEES